MKGIKKLCIRLPILCITCLLSLNLFSNANAYELIADRYVKSFNFTTYGSQPYNNTQYSYTLDGSFTSPLMKFEVPANGRVAFNLLEINLWNEIEFKTSEKFKFDMIFYDYSTAINNLSFSFPACPKGTNNFAITSCEFEVLDSSNPIQFPTTFPTTTTQNSSIYYSVLHIEGTRRNSNLTTDKITLRTDGFYNIKNFSDAISQTHYIGIHFSSLDIYKEDSAENEAAEKELEDRDNIESQQTDTENDASDSSEDIGTATTSLTGVVNSFLGNLQNLNANQCTLPEITAYGFSLGQLNLCTFQPPSWVQAISSAVVSLIMLGLALHLFKRIMSIAKGLSGSR